MRKLLNINTRDFDYSADSDSDNNSFASNTKGFREWPKLSWFGNNRADDAQADHRNDVFPKLQHRRRKSETFGPQYINTKELRVCVGTWNVGGQLPFEDLDIADWIDRDDPADIYVFRYFVYTTIVVRGARRTEALGIAHCCPRSLSSPSFESFTAVILGTSPSLSSFDPTIPLLGL